MTSGLVVNFVLQIIFKVLLNRLADVIYQAQSDDLTQPMISSHQQPLHLKAQIDEEPACFICDTNGECDGWEDQVHQRVCLGVHDIQ